MSWVASEGPQVGSMYPMRPWPLEVAEADGEADEADDEDAVFGDDLDADVDDDADEDDVEEESKDPDDSSEEW